MVGRLDMPGVRNRRLVLRRARKPHTPCVRVRQYEVWVLLLPMRDASVSLINCVFPQLAGALWTTLK